jgi:hypothetical protein
MMRPIRWRVNIVIPGLTQHLEYANSNNLNCRTYWSPSGAQATSLLALKRFNSLLSDYFVQRWALIHWDLTVFASRITWYITTFDPQGMMFLLTLLSTLLYLGSVRRHQISMISTTLLYITLLASISNAQYAGNSETPAAAPAQTLIVPNLTQLALTAAWLA